MGRYESQRAIAARTIYERRNGRKRGLLDWAGWTLARTGGLVLTVAAILAAAWFTPGAPAPAPQQLAAPIQARDLSTFKIAAEPAAIAPAPRRHGIHRSVVEAEGQTSLDPFEGADILSLAELDGISQAR